ncbi:iron-containing alcohol dehydrogenase [Bacillus paralicheniformis]|jgi:alcohol dehydrogenase YqhD (iron-dependent ADH family)|uniref:Iron-containing alcohol dehydrogenase n=1 Tax=Bacillus paralicheniformis TaxID=1648923 RepID=A0ABY3G1P9_9BACI|nr:MULTISPECIES: iron-containing alcohol dehydrogenase [Bacillus]KUL09048.1 NADH-dependent butanol dehydrogenase A [Bacillus licheniformis LMG 7559]KUL15675.1 NADH-dependent butanol dehydrogenase A [Bacillus licheniformis LMG 6934]AGN35044.1 putative NADH-dependent butanol dehydrogenase YugK [Bacillus paralicheniformis ATCC 9945a]AYQ15158.1 iron-containing alcohol dehydrogenase [Bacillus paralicheniformis]KFM90115.1 iron-containing alcohol dehydrogenase family protein [Bacillus paralicheniform
MENFSYYNPTKLIFGKGQLEQLRKELKVYGKNVLIVYGGGSIKKNGLYDEVTRVLKEEGADMHELSGVEPNPRLATVKKGIELCARHEIDFLLAVGGGSVIDCTKAIAAGAKYDGDPWDIFSKKTTAKDALPFGTILTLAATGSEMNPDSVITNWETNEKYVWGSDVTHPKFSILDPENTFSVPENQTVYGIVDMMSHVFEQYFHNVKNTPLQDRMCFSVLQTVIETAPKLLEDLQNYEHRETILYAGTIALNGTLQMGYFGDWASHTMEHAVSAVYDIPHAGGLAILFPNWMRYTLDTNVSRFKALMLNMFDIDTEGKTDKDIALEGIDKLSAFWTSLGAPSRLADYGIGEEKLDLIADIAAKEIEHGGFANFQKLNKDDVLAILRASL